MPGISLKCVFHKKVEENYDTLYKEFLIALDSTIYDVSYKIEILSKEIPYLIGCSRYPEYPVKIFDNESSWICLEGKIYDKQERVVLCEINEVVNRIFTNKLTTDEDKKIIADWLVRTDGDFIIYALNKNTGDFVIMNDVLGRLPLYYYCKEGMEMIVSRDLPFISTLIHDGVDDGSKFDRMGIAQYLLTGSTLGKRTLVTNMNRLEPATIIRIINNSEIKIDKISCLNFDKETDTNLSVKRNAKELVSLFSNACKNRAVDNAKNIIFLSGGFDSRAVLASFHKNKIAGFGATLVDPGWTPVVGTTSEAEVAEELSKSLGFEWENYDFDNPHADDLLRLLRMKNGFLYLAFGYLIRSLDKLKEKHCSSANRIFTGSGGEIVRADPVRIQIKEMDNLLSIMLFGKTSFSLTDVSTLVRIKESEIMDEIKNNLYSYPESNLNKKLMHFLYYENGTKISFDTEDIYRIYFWTASPFFSLPFFIYAMNSPDENKAGDALYKQFLDMLSPSVAAIITSNWGCSISSRKYKTLQFLFSLYWKYPKVHKIIESILSFQWKYPKLNRIILKKDNRSYKDNSGIIGCMREQVNVCHNISNYLSLGGMENILSNYGKYSRVSIYRLFTLTLLMENTLCNKNTIEKYFD